MRTSTICWYRINRWFTPILCGLQQQHTNSVRTATTAYYYLENGNNRIPILYGLQQQHTNTVRTATTAYYYREDGNNRIPLLCGLQQQHTNTLRIANIRILIRCGRQPQHTNTVRTAAPATNTEQTSTIAYFYRADDNSSILIPWDSRNSIQILCWLH